jgi:hypothetical protein
LRNKFPNQAFTQTVCKKAYNAPLALGLLSQMKPAKTYINAQGQIVPANPWRWSRVPAVLWLAVIGTTLPIFLLLARLVELAVQRKPITRDDDLHLTVFTLLLCFAGTAFFGFVVYMMARPEEPDELMQSLSKNYPPETEGEANR